MQQLTLLPLFIFIYFLIPCLPAEAKVGTYEEYVELENQRELKKQQSYEEYLRSEEKIRELENQITPEDAERLRLVEVESVNIVPSTFGRTNPLLPYKLRRPDWGQTINIAYNMYKPINYESKLYPASFESLYGTDGDAMIELSYEYKWNFSLGSLGLDLGYGIYSNNAADTDAIGNATFEVQMARLGLRYTINNIFYEPKIAPYVLGGAYTIFYDESQTDNSQGGTTELAPYYGFGMLFQLSWIDPRAAVASYAESGVENTFIFAEARQYMASSANLDPDFSTDLDFNFGFNIEF